MCPLESLSKMGSNLSHLRGVWIAYKSSLLPISRSDATSKRLVLKTLNSDRTNTVRKAMSTEVISTTDRYRGTENNSQLCHDLVRKRSQTVPFECRPYRFRQIQLVSKSIRATLVKEHTSKRIYESIFRQCAEMKPVCQSQRLPPPYPSPKKITHFF